ncbi:TIGR00159 family protein [bacterium]|nr:MAG: TIGR00159 family protein [bacterium]
MLLLQSAVPTLWPHFKHLLRQVDVVAVLDIFLVATAIYYLLLLAKGTRAMQLLKGVAILLVVMKSAQWLGLDTLYWVISQALFASALVLVILFQPELRAALDQLGRGRLGILGLRLNPAQREAQHRVADEIARAVEKLSSQRIGALLAIERETGLDDIAGTGTPLGARLSAELLGAIFQPGNPLHDGGAIVRGETVVAAACILPLSGNAELPRSVGTRHRAALGLSEATDAVIVVVSEETGNISVARQRTMTSFIGAKPFADELRALLVQSNDGGAAKLRPFARHLGKTAVSLPRETLGTLRSVIRPRS